MDTRPSWQGPGAVGYIKTALAKAAGGTIKR
jgi:hypothetical protein